jgi:predicted Zn-dependent peptidase
MADGSFESPNGGGERLRFHRKDTEQYHLCLGAPGIPRGDDRRFALRVLDTILGGSTSSRLFQEVREKRGLAYSVYSYTSQYADSGQVALYVGTRPENVSEAFEVIGQELRRLIEDGVTEEELERARENVKGRTVLSVDEVLAAFDAVTLDDVTGLARELWQPESLAAAGVGADEGAFRSALGSVSAELAA